MELIYRENILDHYKNPRNKKELTNYTTQVEQRLAHLQQLSESNRASLKDTVIPITIKKDIL